MWFLALPWLLALPRLFAGTVVRWTIMRRAMVWRARMLMVLESLKLMLNVVLQPGLDFEPVLDEFALDRRSSIVEEGESLIEDIVGSLLRSSPVLLNSVQDMMSTAWKFLHERGLFGVVRIWVLDGQLAKDLFIWNDKGTAQGSKGTDVEELHV
jgi:hypothetical protein